MFERFTDAAKEAVQQSQAEARRLKHGFIGTEHLLLGVIATNAVGAGVLAERGLPIEKARQKVQDRMAGHERLTADEALATLGIDLKRVKQRAEAAFGEGALPTPEDHPPPFTPRAKRALENAFRAALELTSEQIQPEHILLGLLRDGVGIAYEVVNAEAKGGAAEVVRETEAQLAAAVHDERPALDPESAVNGLLGIMQIVHGKNAPLPPGDWAGRLRQEAGAGASIFVDARQGEEALTRWVDVAKGLAAGLGLRVFPLGSQTYVLHPPDKRVTPDARRALLERFAVT